MKQSVSLRGSEGSLMDLLDCHCIHCRSSSLRSALRRRLFDALAQQEGGIDCAAAARPTTSSGAFPIWGSSKPTICCRSSRSPPTPRTDQPAAAANRATQVGSFDDLHALLEDYHASPCCGGLPGPPGPPGQRSPVAAEPLSRFLRDPRLLAGLPLTGRRALDAGAGTGFDASMLVRCGAEVTALDFSPLLAGQGRVSLPKARWVGGSARLLPFRDGVFDLVMATHALHHLRDLPLAIGEMLRVLRPAAGSSPPATPSAPTRPARASS